MPKRPRILTAYLRHHYIHGTGDSNEYGLFGEGLFSSIGWDEVYLPFEAAADVVTLDKVRQQGPYDAAFFMPYTEPPTWLRSVVGPDVPIIAWIADDVWRGAFTQELIAAKAADHYVTTCEEALPRYAAAGMAAHVTLSAFGCRPDWWPRLVTRPETPAGRATFTGLLYGQRLARLKSIAAAGKVPIDAYDTQIEVTPLAEYHQRMADSAFTLCLTASSHGTAQHKARLFEAVLHGSVLVTEPAPLMPWAADEAIIETSPLAMQERMTALLADPAAYQAMAERALRHALASETYQHRFAAIFDALRLPVPALPDFTAALDGPGDDAQTPAHVDGL